MAYHVAQVNVSLPVEPLDAPQADGPIPYAFTFRAPFPSPDGISAADDDWFCPA